MFKPPCSPLSREPSFTLSRNHLSLTLSWEPSSTLSREPSSPLSREPSSPYHETIFLLSRKLSFPLSREPSSPPSSRETPTPSLRERSTHRHGNEATVASHSAATSPASSVTDSNLDIIVDQPPNERQQHQAKPWGCVVRQMLDAGYDIINAVNTDWLTALCHAVVDVTASFARSSATRFDCSNMSSHANQNTHMPSHK